MVSEISARIRSGLYKGTDAYMAELIGGRLPELPGEDYLSCLERLHAARRPRTYLEVGTASGNSLKRAQCAAIAVDPKFQLDGSVPTEHMRTLCLFQMRSDEFFEVYDPQKILGTAIDFAFLDGMHLFECLLYDFVHTEKVCHKYSVIALHDCIPLDFHMTRRDIDDVERRNLSVHPDWWTGDVWKIVPVLRHYRPDLTIELFNAACTGLVVIRNLDPKSRVLIDKHEELVGQWRSPANEFELFQRYLTDLEMQDTATITLG